MVQRVRTRTGSNQTGTFKTVGGIPCALTSWNHSWYRFAETCTDNVLDGDGHPFDMTKVEWTGATCEAKGVNCTGQIVPRLINHVPQSFRTMTATPTHHLGIFGRPTNGELAAELLAKTNPSRPVVDLPVAIGELHELPGLLRGHGNGLLRGFARGHILAEFAVRPLISDLSSLLDFQDAFASRMRELNALKEGTLRRKRMLFRGAGHSTQTGIVVNSGTSNGGSITCSVDSHTTETVWGFVRWKPAIGFPQTDDALRRAARRAVLGLTVDFSTAWNLIPWSWLVDWASSTGDYLMANRNLIPCTATGTCIMSHRKTVKVYKKTGGDYPLGLTPTSPIGPWTVVCETKSRSPATPTLDAHLPILNRRQVSILRAIAINKYRR
jgi:hypothetical protein